MRRGTQAREGRLVEDPLEDLVASAHPAVVANPLAGILGGRNQAGVSCEPIRALKGGEVSHAHQELGPEDRTHAGQASEYPGLGAGEKTLPKLPIESVDALLEVEHLTGKLLGDASGDLFGGQDDALGSGRSERLLGDVLGSTDAAVLEEGADPLAARPADLSRSLVMADEGEGAPAVEVQGSLERRKRSQESVSEAGDGPGPVGYEVSAAGEEDLQLGELCLLGGELSKVGSHAGLVGDDMGIAGIGLGLTAVGVAGAIHAEAGDVEDPLPSLPQQSQEQRRAAAGLVDGPDDLTGEGQDFVYESQEVGLIVSDLSGEQLFSRSVECVGSVGLLAGVDPGPGFIHEDLHPSLACLCAENPADGSLCSESRTSPISISGQGLQRDRGAVPFKPSEGRATRAILGPFGRHSGTVPERQTQR